MREIDLIVVHCTATPAGRTVTRRDVDQWHRQRGFAEIGYHFLVGLDGTIETGRAIEKPGAHALGYNQRSIGVAYVGGLDLHGKPTDTRTASQKKALAELLRKLKAAYPGSRITGHNKLAAKACPCFDADNEYASL